MNKIYRLIWDAQNNAFVAVSENTKAKGKKSSKTLLAMALVSSLGIFVTNSAMAACAPLEPSFDNCESASTSATASASSASSALDSATAASTSASTATERVNYIENNIDAIFRDSNTYADLSNRIDQNSSDIRSNRKLAAQGIAGLAAMTNIPSPAIAGTTSIGAGVGYFDSESAIAIGASHYFENNVSIKGSVASGFNSGKSTVVGAGVSYTWQ